MLGLMPVTECGVIRYAANSAGRQAKIRAARQLRLGAFVESSDSPARSGHQTGVVRILFMPVIEQRSATNLLSKLLPWSLCNWQGRPKRLKKAL